MPERERRTIKVKCNLCQSPNVTEYTWHGSTTHMRDHLYDEKGHNLPNAQLSENEEGDYEAECTRKQDRLDRALLAFFLTCSVAFNALTNPQFLYFVHLLCKTHTVPSSYVVSGRILDTEYEKAISQIKMELAKFPGLSVTLDAWACKAQGYPYLGELMNVFGAKMRLFS